MSLRDLVQYAMVFPTKRDNLQSNPLTIQCVVEVAVFFVASLEMRVRQRQSTSEQMIADRGVIASNGISDILHGVSAYTLKVFGTI